MIDLLVSKGADIKAKDIDFRNKIILSYNYNHLQKIIEIKLKK